MAEDFAEAFRRYWLIITTVAVLVTAGLVNAGNLYVSLREEIAEIRSDLRDYGTERIGLLRDINGRFDGMEERLDRLEAAP